MYLYGNIYFHCIHVNMEHDLPSTTSTTNTPIQPMAFTSQLEVDVKLPTIQIVKAVLKSVISDISDQSPQTTQTEMENVVPIADALDNLGLDITEPVALAVLTKVSERITSKLQAMLSVKVSPAVLVLITTVEHEPAFFDTELIHILGEIVKDGVVNTADIPQLLSLFQRVFSLISVPSSLKIDNLGELSLEIVHLLLTIVLAEGWIPGLTPELIVLIDSVLKSAVSMVSHIHLPKSSKKWLKKLFSKCGCV